MNDTRASTNIWIATGPKKAAALLLAMGKPLAGRLLKHFDANELREVTRSAAELGTVPAVAIESVIEEFASQFPEGLELLGSAGEAELMISGVLPPDQVADIMSDVTGISNQAVWEKLSTLTEAVLASYLGKEHPQTAALILGKVTPSCAAKVMGLLPRPLRNEIMRRMLATKPVTEPSMRIIERSLHDDLLANVAQKSSSDTNSRMADIINKMEREQVEDVLQSLTEARPKQAEVLKSLLFTFEDVANLSQQARLVLLDQIPTERVVLALKGTDAAFRDAILSSLAARARRIVEHELTNGGPAAQRDVMKARREIADLALTLHEKGQLELNGSEEDEAVIE